MQKRTPTFSSLSRCVLHFRPRAFPQVRLAAGQWIPVENECEVARRPVSVRPCKLQELIPFPGAAGSVVPAAQRVDPRLRAGAMTVSCRVHTFLVLRALAGVPSLAYGATGPTQ